MPIRARRIKLSRSNEISPYTTPTVTLCIGEGRKEYYIHQSIIEPYPKLGQTHDLLDINEDIGHTLVHFLYTGCYQTWASERTTEFERSVLTYHAASKYEIEGLKMLAKNEAERLGLLMPITAIQKESESISLKIPQVDKWFHGLVQQIVTSEFNANTALRSPDGELLARTGSLSVFDKAVIYYLATRLEHFNGRDLGKGSEPSVAVESAVQPRRDSLGCSCGAEGPRPTEDSDYDACSNTSL